MVEREQIIEALNQVLSGYDVKRAFLFGSYSRERQTEDSDIDLRLQCGKDIDFGQLYDIQTKLEDMLGVELDIVTAHPDQMRPSFRKRIMQDEVLLYAV